MMGLISSIFVAHIIVKVMEGLDGTTQRKLEEEKKANQTYPGTPRTIPPYDERCAFCDREEIGHHFKYSNVNGKWDTWMYCYNNSGCYDGSSNVFTKRAPGAQKGPFEDFERLLNRLYPNIEERLRKVELNMEKNKKQNFSEAYVTDLRNQVNQSKKSD
jgi:hypothetical protein